jgi:glutaminase
MLVDVEGMARFGAMLANNGINPSTGERIVEPETVKATVTLMQTCGMYNGAGKFTKDHGVPTKSGVSGGLMTVIPGIGAVSTYSPPLNEEGNCVRGIGMIEKISSIYNNINLFHKDQKKNDMTRKAYQTLLQTVIAACTSAASGDLETITRLHVQGLDLNHGDYDLRTPLHLASAAGHIDIVKYLIQNGANVSPRDRWGATPLNDAQDQAIVDYLNAHGAQKGLEQTEYLELPQVTVSDD